EAKLDIGLHSDFWLKLGLDTVNARLIDSHTFLPRIPPVRGHIGLDIRHKGLSVRPELILAAAQNKIATTETSTAGYATASLAGSYTITRGHQLHMFSAELF